MTGPDRFTRFACFDWSGAAAARPRGITLAVAEQDGPPRLVERRWSRGDVLDWLCDHANADMLVGLDLSPGLPFLDRGAYFPGWSDSPSEARALWRLVDESSTADPHLGIGSFLHHDEARRHFRHHGQAGDLFTGGRGRLRVCEEKQRVMRLSPSSCFNLVGAAQVGKSSLTGMRVLHRLAGRIPVWPFNPVPDRGAMIVEIYTTIAARAAGLRAGRSKVRDPASLDRALAALGSPAHRPLTRYDDHATDAILTAAWLRDVAHDPALWSPERMTPQVAATEGWTFGVP